MCTNLVTTGVIGASASRSNCLCFPFVASIIVCLPWSHNSACSMYFESAHRNGKLPHRCDSLVFGGHCTVMAIIEHEFVDVICTVRRTGSSKALSEGPKGE